MSKTLALLKHLEEQKAVKENGNCPRKTTATSAISAKTVSFWIVSVIIVIMLIILSVFDQKLLSMIRENTAENFLTSEKLNKIENLLTDYARQASVNSDVIHKLSNLLDNIDTRLKETADDVTKLKESNEEKFSQLKKSADTQVSAMQLLTKEKDELFDKIRSLETEIKKIKAENTSRAAAANVTNAAAVIE
ncbi:MAG: hypothetical protein V2A57_03385 [Elusimicrobiota bacterium]